MTRVGEIALAEQIRGRPGAAQARIEAFLNRFPADSIPLAHRFVVQPGLRWGAAQLGRLDLAGRIRQAYPLLEPMPRIMRHGQLVAEAAEALARDDATRAAELMREAGGYDAAFPPFRYLVDLVSGMAFEALSEFDSAIAYLERAAHPGHMAGWTPARVLRPVLERRLAELEEARGNADAAVRHYRRIFELWSDADPELQDQLGSARRALALLGGLEDR
jgi:tetratricopeptide (TPR) repeat protein